MNKTKVGHMMQMRLEYDREDLLSHYSVKVTQFQVWFNVSLDYV